MELTTLFPFSVQVGDILEWEGASVFDGFGLTRQFWTCRVYNVTAEDVSIGHIDQSQKLWIVSFQWLLAEAREGTIRPAQNTASIKPNPDVAYL